MERVLSLVESDFGLIQKRKFPRFPYSYLVFLTNGSERKVEIKDISHSGMQLESKLDPVSQRSGDEVSGKIMGFGSEVEVYGRVEWVKEQRMGLSFSKNCLPAVKDYLREEKLSKWMKPLTNSHLAANLPQGLRVWLRTDGPIELFMWQDSGGVISEFQVIVMENFVEWEASEGARTGRVLSKRSLETPLASSDEFVFELDQTLSKARVDKAVKIIENLSSDQLALEFKELALRELT